ncbi:MAG: hypothetical protein ACXVPR_08575 [Actinomycetota bacterium]
MSNGKGKNRKKPRASSSRPATRTTTATKSTRASSNAPSSGGLLGRVLGPAVPPSMSEMPTFRRSLGQGFLLVSSNAVLVFGPLVFVYLVWLVLIAFGFVGTALALTQVVAMPPLSTAFDTQNAISIAGQQSGLIVALPLLLFRAVIVCVLSGLLVEGFERRGSTSLGGVMRGLAAFPLVLAYLMLSFVALFLAQFGSVFGPGLGTLLQVLLPAFVLWAVGFVPFAAVRERRPLADTLRRSYAAARTPGGRHLSFCIVYVLLAFVLPLFVPGRSLITANPAPATGIGLYLLSFLHVGFTAAMAYRWLAVESSIPETLARR